MTWRPKSVIEYCVGSVRAVGRAVAEQVDGDHVVAGVGQRPRERLVHAARHQLSVDQDHPSVTGSVLGVLQPVLALVEEMTGSFGRKTHGSQQ